MKWPGAALPSAFSVLALASCLALVLYASAEPAAAEAPSAGPEVGRLIEDLGSKDFDARKAATRALMELDDALPALRRAEGAADLEVRRRVVAILEALEQRRALRGLARAEALAREGRIVEAVDRIVAFAGRDKGGAGGQTLTRFAARLLEAIPKDDLRRLDPLGDILTGNLRDRFPAGDFRTYVKAISPKELIGGKLSYRRVPRPDDTGVIFTRSDEMSWDGIDWSLVAASGDVCASPGGVKFSVIVAGGNLKVGNAQGTLFVCDGDVEFPTFADGCAIVARGKVTSLRGMPKCVIRSEGSFLHLDRNGKKILLKDGTPDPFAFIKFFELSDVGLTVAEPEGPGEPVQDGVCLKEVRKGSPFSPALQAGDVVTAIDGTKAASQEVFRRLLRKRMAQGGPRITFTVRRAGQNVEVAVRVKD
jgi:hypothetical protein